MNMVYEISKVYKIECSLYIQPIYTITWDNVVAFLRHTIGFDTKITSVPASEVSGEDAYVWAILDDLTDICKVKEYLASHPEFKLV